MKVFERSGFWSLVWMSILIGSILPVPGCSRKVKQQVPAPSASALLKQIENAQVPGAPVTPAADEHPEVPRVLERSAFMKPKPGFKPTVDILAQLNIRIENEYGGEFGITDEAIRGAADLSYARLHIANQSIRGWALAVRPAEGGIANTSFNSRARRIVINVDQAVWFDTAPHELTHALQGEVVEKNWLPGFLKEYVATSAEDVDAKKVDFPYTYEQLNRPVLSIAKGVNGEEHQINANNAPLDGLRYELLRAGAIKIGTEEYRKLAVKIHEFAQARRAPVPLQEFKPFFDAAGLGDCVLFRTVTATGVSLDVAMLKNGMPIVIYKQIDQNGIESVPMSSLRVILRKDGKAITTWTGGTSPGGMLMDQGAMLNSVYADTYEVTIGQTVYTYKIREGALH